MQFVTRLKPLTLTTLLTLVVIFPNGSAKNRQTSNA